MRRLPVPFSPEEDARILAEDAAGKTLREIAELVDRPYSSVVNRLQRIAAPARALQAAEAERQRLQRLQENEEKRLQRLQEAEEKRLQAQQQAAALQPAPAPAPAPAPVAASGPGGMVKCLFGCGKTFNSPDRARIRCCPTCRRGKTQSRHGLPESWLVA
jgi:hypothetical protein